MVAGDMEIIRQRIDVDIRRVSLRWSRRESSKQILQSINARFPSGEVTAILVRRESQTNESSLKPVAGTIGCREE